MDGETEAEVRPGINLSLKASLGQPNSGHGKTLTTEFQGPGRDSQNGKDREPTPFQPVPLSTEARLPPSRRGH